MEKKDSLENSWADQWDYNHRPPPVAADSNNRKSSGGSSAKYSKKFGQSFNKTKAAASTGMKKVKDGASVGINWVKLKVKYQKSNNSSNNNDLSNVTH